MRYIISSCDGAHPWYHQHLEVAFPERRFLSMAAGILSALKKVAEQLMAAYQS